MLFIWCFHLIVSYLPCICSMKCGEKKEKEIRRGISIIDIVGESWVFSFLMGKVEMSMLFFFFCFNMLRVQWILWFSGAFSLSWLKVLEETGFDVSKLLAKDAYIELMFGKQRVRLYIIAGVSDGASFAPLTKKEISVWASFSLYIGFNFFSCILKHNTPLAPSWKWYAYLFCTWLSPP